MPPWALTPPPPINASHPFFGTFARRETQNGRMRFRRLETPDEWGAYLRRYCEEAGQPCTDAMVRDLCDSYLSRGQVHGLFDRDGSMCGGYVVQEGRNARWIPRLPTQAVDDLSNVIDDGLELNLVWLAGPYRKAMTALRLWTRISRDLGRARDRKFVTFTAETRKAGLDRLYRTVASGVLYEGPFSGLSGTYRLYWSTPRKFRWIPLLYLPTYARFALAGNTTRGGR